MSISIPSGTYPIAAPSPIAAIASLGRALWHTLGRLGALRAAGEMRRLADQYQDVNPALARRLRESADAGLW